MDENMSIAALLHLGIQQNFVQSPNSRYRSTEIAVLERPDGRKLVYLRRRFLPQPEEFALLQEHTVSAGDRLDNITAHYLVDPEQFWRICDANRAMIPDELTAQIGRRLRIPLPGGVPGNDNA